MEKMIELSPAQNTAYFWVDRIRTFTREIAESREFSNSRPISMGEYDFYEKFSKFTEEDWRNLYVKLSEKIEEDINNYVPPKSKSWKFVEFSQDTLKGGHDRLIQELEEIVGKGVPDIDLSGEYHDGAVIYSAKNGIQIFDRYSGFINMFPINRAEYILTGNKSELNFYELLIMTINEIFEKDKSFDSVEILREGFKKAYKKYYDSKISEEEYKNLFDKYFDIMEERGLILGNSKQTTYWPRFLNYDIRNNSLSPKGYLKDIMKIQNFGNSSWVADIVLSMQNEDIEAQKS